MKYFKNLVVNFWPIAFLVVVSLILFLANYVPGTFLLGWDNTVPELNLSLNLSRFLSGVWQEYRGLGTLDGMAHSANIVHWLYSALLSLFFPTSVIRYLINILTHLFGGIGIYFLTTDWLIPYFLNLRKNNDKSSQLHNSLIGLVVALFYMFNLMTIQMYHMPLELFSFHFAILPWGVWTLLRYFKKPTLKSLFFFFLVNILGVSQAHVPTLFIVYSFIIGVILLFHLIQSPRFHWRSVFLAGFILLLANSFWGLPYAYTVTHKTEEIANSKQNRFGTDSIFYRNFARGDLKTIMTYGGFRLDYQDWNIAQGEFEPIMKNWVSWYLSTPYQTIAVFFSLLATSGVVLTLRIFLIKKDYLILSLVLLWLFALTMLGTNIPVFGNIFKLLQTYIPLFYQVFRFTFTKFSLMYVFLVSLFIGIFLLELVLFKFFKKVSVVILAIILFLILYHTAPVFSGNFFYSALRVRLPDYYQSFINDFNNKDNNFRYAIFPIHSFWGWTTNTNDWGYRGSGFLWQAVKQAMVDRSFDPWSKTNETMYLQMNRSLYQQDSEAFLKTFNKYFTDYVVFDHSIFHPGNYPEALFSDEIKQFFTSIAKIKKEQTYGKLDIYKFDIANSLTNIRAPKEVVLIDSNYTTDYSTRDQAYLDYADYLQNNSLTSINYPFSYLQQDQLQKFPQITDEGLIFEQSYSSPTSIVIPSIGKSQDQLQTLIYGDIKDNELALKLETLIPEITIDNQVIPADRFSQVVTQIDLEKDYYLVMNQDFVFLDSKKLSENSSILGSVQLLTKENVELSLFDTKAKSVLPIKNADLIVEKEECSAGKNCYKTIIKTPSSQSEKVFAIFLTNFQMEENDSPQVCFHSIKDKTCLGKSFVLNSDNKTLGVAVKVSPDTNYEVVLSSPLNTKSQYQNMQLQTFDEITSWDISLRDVIAKFDKNIEEYLKKPTQHLMVKVPLGKQNSAVIKEDWISSRSEKSNRNCQNEDKGSVDRVFSNDGVEYSASNGAIVCDSYWFPEINQDIQYLFNMKGEVKSGIGLKGFLLNTFTKRFDIEMVTRTGKYDLWYPLNPSRNLYQGDLTGFFRFNVNGETYGLETNHSIINKIDFYPLPLNWLIKIHSKPEVFRQNFITNIKNNLKLRSFLYVSLVEVKSEVGLITLPQSFDQGWIALIRPSSQAFLISNYSLLSHYQYNGWANAWYLPEGEWEVMIVFWPQLLSFVGLGFLIGSFAWFGSFFISQRHKKFN